MLMVAPMDSSCRLGRSLVTSRLLGQPGGHDSSTNGGETGRSFHCFFGDPLATDASGRRIGDQQTIELSAPLAHRVKH